MDADVVVIGAGPAGGNAARLLSREGLEVLLLDMRSEVGRPVQCGEAVSSFALRKNRVVPGDWALHRVRGIAVHSPSGEAAHVSVEGYCVDRAAFDRQLVEEAEADGAEVKTRCHVLSVVRGRDGWEARTSQGRFRGRFMVAADGPKSPTATSLGLLAQRTTNLGLQYKFPADGIDVEGEWLHLYLSEAYGGGYAWIFPRGMTVSVGIDAGSHVKEHLHDFCRSLGLDPARRLETNGGLIPVTVRLRKLGFRGLLVVGDAAGATNPIFGGGIHAALTTGRMAAEAILAAANVEPSKASQRYHRQALRSPFFHPALHFVARRLHSATDIELNLAVEVFKYRRDPLGLVHHLPTFLDRPALMARALEMPLLAKALMLTIRYGW